MSTTEHDVALFEEEDGFKFLLVWIDSADFEEWRESYDEAAWQAAIEEHPFITERNLPVVIAFENDEGEPRLYGPREYVKKIVDNFDWDNINWGYKLTLEWDDE